MRLPACPQKSELCPVGQIKKLQTMFCLQSGRTPARRVSFVLFLRRHDRDARSEDFRETCRCIRLFFDFAVSRDAVLGDIESDVFFLFRDAKPNRHVEKFQERIASATGDDHGNQDAERLNAEPQPSGA